MLATKLCAFAAFITIGTLSHANAETSRDTLVIGLDVKPKTSDPRLVGDDANSQYIGELRFLPLISFDENGEVKNILANKITPNSAKSWKVTLKSGIKFANGRTINADDVVATYRYVVSTPANSSGPRKAAFDTIEEVKTLSANEVVFTLKTPFADFASELVVGILPKEAITAPFEQINGKGFESGPYILEKYTDDAWFLVRNEKFSGAVTGINNSKLPKVIFKIITDNSARFIALLKGDVDLVQNAFNPDKVVEIQNNYKNKLILTTKPQTSTTSLAFNMKDSVLSKLKVRQALQKGINRDEILQFVLQGLGAKAVGIFAVGNAFRNNSLAEIKYDPDGAKKLLDEAGYPLPDGKGPKARLTLSLKTDNNQERIAIVKAISGQLKAIGVNLEIEVLEAGSFSEQLSKGNVAIWLQHWTGFKNPSILEFAFHSANIFPKGGNRGFFSNAQLDVLLNKGKSELITDKRVAIYNEAQKVIATELPSIFLWQKLGTIAVKKGVNNYKLYADGRYLFVVDVTK